MSLYPHWLQRRTPVPRPRCRLVVEPLEDRTLLTVYTVNTIKDLLNDSNAGELSLRDVITAIDSQHASGHASAGTTSNTIDFQIGGLGTVQTIDLTSPLPAITQKVLIDGWSQGGVRYAGPPLIVLNGADAGGSADGLEFEAGSDGGILRGLVIQSFSANGIEIRGASGIQITANYLGTNAAGTKALGNGADAILIDQGATNNIIGGTSRGAGNVICGSVNAPIGGTAGTQTSTFALSPAAIAGNTASFNVTVNYTDAAGFQMVYVGVDLRGNQGTLAPTDPTTGQPDFSAFSFTPSGTFGSNWQPVDNAFPGEFLLQTQPSTGLAPNASYVIGTITYNLAKFDVTPSASLFVALDGIDTVIGAEEPGVPATFTFVNPNFAVAQQPLVNAAPTTVGIEIAGSGTRGNQVLGNLIGVGPSGAAILGQLSDGVLIDSGAAHNTVAGGNIVAGSDTGILLTDAGTTGNTVLGNHIGTDLHGTLDLADTVAGVLLENGAAGNTIGGTSAANANVIAFDGQGVVVGNGSADTTTIHDTVLGNRIYANVVAPITLGNQPATTDSANPRAYPNDGQNAPLIAMLTPTTIRGSLSSVPHTSFRLEFFANPTSGVPGQTFLGFLNVTTTAAGYATFTLPIASLPIGCVVTATATNLATGDTSASSPVGTQVLILANPTITVSGAVQVVPVSIQILTANGPATSGQVTVNIPGIPGPMTITPTGQAVVTVNIPVPAQIAAGSYAILASVLDEDDVPEFAAAGRLTITGGIARRWTR